MFRRHKKSSPDGANPYEDMRAMALGAVDKGLEVIEREALTSLDPDPGTHPPPGYVRYHVLGADGLQGIDVTDDIFWGERGNGGNLVDAAQYLIHTISNADPAQS